MTDEKTSEDLRLCESLFMQSQNAFNRTREVCELMYSANELPPERMHEQTNPDDRSIDTRPKCVTARMDAEKLVSAHMTHITPMGQRWFSYAPRDPKEEDDQAMDEEDWYAESSQTTLEYLERSNFYTEQIGVYTDRVRRGTAAAIIEMSTDGELVFTHVPTGTFACAENSLHKIDTFVRRVKLSPRQCVDLFGYDNLSTETQQRSNDADTKYKVDVELYQLIEPRPKKDLPRYRDLKEMNQLLMPYRNVWIEKSSGHKVIEGGYHEFPVMVTRFLRMEESAYGVSPFEAVLEDMRDLIKLEDALLTAAQRRAIPSVLITPDLVGHIDMRAGGQTILNPNMGGADLPREWAPSSDTRDLIEHINRKEKHIHDASMVTALQSVSIVDHQMTAREVSAREAEAVMTLTQSFTQCKVDLDQMLYRVFAMLLRSGAFPEENMPDGLLERDEIGGKQLEHLVAAPKFKYVGRMAQQLQYAQQNGLANIVGELVELQKATGDPRWTMPLDVTKIARYKVQVSNAPYKCLKKASEVAKEEEQMRAAATQQQQMAMFQQAAAANRDNATAEAQYRQT